MGYGPRATDYGSFFPESGARGLEPDTQIDLIPAGLVFVTSCPVLKESAWAQAAPKLKGAKAG
jgi:hypothetical protein